jgi:myo-inositol-1(or 4)-monophosphatase
MTSPELRVAVAAVEAAGERLLAHFSDGVDAVWKGDRDPVTEADHEVEALIRAHISDAFPDDLVVGEEGEELDEAAVAGRRRWYVDPLDGTTNFLKTHRRWASSIGFCDARGQMQAAAVRLPLWRETYTATRGGGAWCNGAPVQATATSAVGESLVLVGALGDAVDRVTVAALGGSALSVRVTGSTVADLVDIAAGRADAFFATTPGRWDLAAGVLLATEAGARVTDLQGREVASTAPTVLAAAADVHDALLEIVRRD